MKNWTVIISLRQVTNAGLPYAEKALAGVHTEFVERVAINPEYKKIFVNIDGSNAPLSEKGKELIRTVMTQGTIMRVFGDKSGAGLQILLRPRLLPSPRSWFGVAELIRRQESGWSYIKRGY